MLVLGAALGDCVHVAGVLNFLGAARRSGHRTEFLGPAVSVENLVSAAVERGADLLAVSYRLTPEAADRLFARLEAALAGAGLAGQRMVFGGTEPVVEVARRTGLFEEVFGGSAGPSVEEYLTGSGVEARDRPWPRTLLARRERVAPRPLIRHHFGLPDVESTVEGVARIADSGLVDVISLGPDQNAQEFFFHPEHMDPAQDGAGGVPVRSPEDLHRISLATRHGNHPMLRCYSGTNDQIAFAEMLQESIENAWCAVPVFWYSELDGRSTRSLEAAIGEQGELVAWCAARSVPVERNDQNQWGLRYAHDALQVASAALAGQLTARAGVTTYVLQMMLNNPPGISPAMDVAKMGAMDALVRRRVGDEVTVLRQARAGLFSLPPDPDRARGQLASSVRTAMLLDPDVVHVVGHTEAHHVIGPDELIASCSLVHQVIDDASAGLPDPFADPAVSVRREHLVSEAEYLLDVIEDRHPAALEGDPDSLAAVVRSGLFDAPYLAGNPAGRGEVVTVVEGGCDAVDPETGEVLGEVARLAVLDEQ
jgi:hypothetical protein